MRSLVYTGFVSLDGVVDSPGGGPGEEHRSGGWVVKDLEFVPEAWSLKGEELTETTALMFGRRSYEAFAAVWPGSEDHAGYKELPKYVVSTTLKDPAWNNSHVIDPHNLVDEVNRLKQEGDGLLAVHGSNTLIEALMEHDLVDEYRLMVFPVVLGWGKKLFQDGRPRADLKLTSSQPVGPDGVIVLTYEPARG